MRCTRFVIYTTILCLFIATLILAVSCDYADPLEPIYNRIGTYTNETVEYEIIISDDASTITVTVPNNDYDEDDEDSLTHSEYTITTYGSNDVRLSFYATTNIRLILDGEDFTKAYLYTNHYNDDETYSTCTKTSGS